MSWSVSAIGPVGKITGQLEQQFDAIHLNDSGEQETVANTKALVIQTLSTIDPDKPVNVVASGSMGFRDWSAKTGPFQSVDLKIAPIHFSV